MDDKHRLQQLILENERLRQDNLQLSHDLAAANTRLQQVNEDFQRLKERYRDLYHRAPVMYFALDARGLFVACNDTMRRTLGYEHEKLLAQPYTRILAPQSHVEYLDNPRVYQLDGELATKWMKKDGTIFEVWVRNAPILDDQGRFLRSRSVAQVIINWTRSDWHPIGPDTR
jgi:PAS domain S-box-containing protein